MITITPVIYSGYKRKDGTYAVRMRVTYKRVSRFVSTNINIDASDLTKSLKIRNAAFRDLVEDFARDMRRAAARIPFSELQYMECADVCDKIMAIIAAESAPAFSLDIVEYGRQKAAKMKASTGRVYRISINALRRFAGDKVDIMSITPSFLRSYEEFLRAEPRQQGGGNMKNGTAMHVYLSSLRRIYRLAMYEYNDDDIVRIPRDPFLRYHVPAPAPVKHRNRGIDVIQSVINSSLHPDDESGKVERLALDVFLLSFCLMGMNMADLYECGPASGGVLVYYRKKTRDRRDDRAEHRVRIEREAEALVNKYKDKSGARMFDFYKRYYSTDAFTMMVNLGLKRWCGRMGIEPFTFYTARHSWATIARSSKCGIDKATVNECLCHVDPDMRIADVYIERDWEVLWSANRKVLDLFDFGVDNQKK